MMMKGKARMQNRFGLSQKGYQVNGEAARVEAPLGDINFVVFTYVDIHLCCVLFVFVQHYQRITCIIKLRYSVCTSMHHKCNWEKRVWDFIDSTGDCKLYEERHHYSTVKLLQLCRSQLLDETKLLSSIYMMNCS